MGKKPTKDDLDLQLRICRSGMIDLARMLHAMGDHAAAAEASVTADWLDERREALKADHSGGVNKMVKEANRGSK